MAKPESGHTLIEKMRMARGLQVTWVSGCVNAALAVLKIFVGFFGGSAALFSDGIHSFADVLCGVMVYVAIKFGQAKADANHPYGHQRFETLATLALGVFLLVLAFGIAWSAADHLLKHHFEHPDNWTLVVAVVSIVVNEGLFRYQMRAAKRVSSTLVEANAWHSRGDALASMVVFIGIIGAMAGSLMMDALATLFVAGLIGKMGIHWVWRALYELSDGAIDARAISDLKKIIQETPGVLHMHQLRARQMGDKITLDVHIEIEPYSSASEGHCVAERVEIFLTSLPWVLSAVVHVDVDSCADNRLPCVLPTRAELLARLEPKWSEVLSLEEIARVVLHYLGGKVEIELHLKASLTPTPSQVAALKNSVAGEPDIHFLTIHQLQ